MFGFVATADTISNLRVAGIVPLLVALAAGYIFRKHQGLIMAMGFLVYLLYQAGIFLFVHQAA